MSRPPAGRETERSIRRPEWRDFPSLSNRISPPPPDVGLFARLVPWATSVETFFDAPPSTLFPGEDAAVSRAAIERRREFCTVRHCARQAMLKLGVSPHAIPRDADGTPQWPTGVVGSLTHCPGYRAAVVALSHRLCAIGIDAEPHAELSDATLDLVLRDEERARMKSLAAARPNRHWDRVHFCAKEAVYKAWFSLTRRWLEFEDVSITFDLAGTFSARIDVSEPVAMGVDLSRLGGRWAIGSGLVVAATWVHARPAGSVEFV